MGPAVEAVRGLVVAFMVLVVAAVSAAGLAPRRPPVWGAEVAVVVIAAVAGTEVAGAPNRPPEGFDAAAANRDGTKDAVVVATGAAADVVVVDVVVAGPKRLVTPLKRPPDLGASEAAGVADAETLVPSPRRPPEEGAAVVVAPADVEVVVAVASVLPNRLGFEEAAPPKRSEGGAEAGVEEPPAAAGGVAAPNIPVLAALKRPPGFEASVVGGAPAGVVESPAKSGFAGVVV